MSDFVHMSTDLEQGLVQSLLNGKQQAFALANTLDALEPLLESEEFSTKLSDCLVVVKKTAYLLGELYRRNAKEAFKSEG
jgi:hypothetical protein